MNEASVELHVIYFNLRIFHSNVHFVEEEQTFFSLSFGMTVKGKATLAPTFPSRLSLVSDLLNEAQEVFAEADLPSC